MPTLLTFRILLVVPVAKVATVANWFQTNIGANSVPDDLGPGLSPTGNAPATYRWMSGAYQDAEARLVLRQLCILAGVTPPTVAEWGGWTRAEKIAWLRSVRSAIRTGYGVGVLLSANDDAWDDPVEELAGGGLRVIG